MVHEAQQKKAQILEELSRERNLLERKIDELRTFERDYRARLKNYIEAQLADLEQTGVEPAEAGDGEAQGEGEHAGRPAVAGPASTGSSARRERPPHRGGRSRVRGAPVSRRTGPSRSTAAARRRGSGWPGRSR